MKKFLAATMLLWSSIALCAQPAPILRTQFTTNASTAGNSKLVRTTATGAPAPVTIGTGISFDGTTLSGTGTNLPSLFVNGANVAGANLTNSASLNVSVTSSNISFTPTNLTIAQFANSIITNLGLLSWTNIWSGTNTFNVIPIVPNNSFALGTKTTGNFVSDVAGTAAEVTVTHTPSEGSTATISLPIAMTLTGKVLTGGTYSNSTLVTPALGVATGTSVALGADPADAGVLRLENGALIAWESSPASTDLTLTVNSSELFVFSADVTVPDLAYNAGTWDGSLAVPTRNAMRDKIEAMSAASGVPIQVNGTNLTVLQVTNSATVTWSLGAGSNLTATATGGAQTPWGSDIDGAGFALTNASGISLSSTNAGAMLFNEASANGTDLVRLTAPASLAATVTNTLPSTTGTLLNDASTIPLATLASTVTIVDGADSTSFPTFVGTITGNLAILTDPTFTFDPTTGTLGATTFVGALTGNASTATASASSTIADGADPTSFPVFVGTITGDRPLLTDPTFIFDPTTGTLGATAFVGSGTGLTGLDAADMGSGLVSNSEFGFLDGVTGSIQTALDARVPTTRTITINGTANEVSVAGSVQDLSANRTWTASLPTDLTFTGKVVTGGTFSNLTIAGTPTMSLGSDATGDVYYRNSSGFLTRLGVGADGTVLKLSGGIPSWGTDDTAGAPVWNTIGDAAADGSVAFGQTTQDITGNTDDVTAIAQDVLRITLTNDGATDVLTQRVLVVRNASATGGTTEVLLDLENNDNSTVTTGLSIEGTSTGAITTAIDVSDAEIVTAMAAGANNLTGTSWSIGGAGGSFVVGSLTNNALTASQAVVTDANKALASVAYTGAGNVMRTRTGVWRSQWIDAGAWKPSQTNPAVAATIIAPTGADYVTEDCYGFNDTTEQSVEFKFKFPRTWDAGTIKFTVDWKATSTAGTNVWALKAKSVADKESTAGSWGAEVTVLDETDATANELNTAPISAALTVGGTPAVGETVYFKLSRKPTDGSDNLSGDGKATGLWIDWLESTTEPAAP